MIVAPLKFDVLKTNICPRSKVSRANMLVLRTSNFQGATIRPIVPRHKHSPLNDIHEKKLLDSDWLRAVQFKCNTSANYTS